METAKSNWVSPEGRVEVQRVMASISFSPRNARNKQEEPNPVGSKSLKAYPMQQAQVNPMTGGDTVRSTLTENDVPCRVISNIVAGRAERPNRIQIETDLQDS